MSGAHSRTHATLMRRWVCLLFATWTLGAACASARVLLQDNSTTVNPPGTSSTGGTLVNAAGGTSSGLGNGSDAAQSTQTPGNAFTSSAAVDQLATNPELNNAGGSNSSGNAASADQASQSCTYNVSSLQDAGDGGNVTAGLTLAQDGWPQFGSGFQELALYIMPETPTRLHIKAQPSGGASRFLYPESLVPRPPAQRFRDAPLYKVAPLQQGGSFALNVSRRSNGQPMFDTSGTSLCFKDQYIELTTAVPVDADLYGLGESSLPTGMLLPRNGTIITLWTRDIGSNTAWANLYGAHPFLLQVNSDGSAHGVVFLNSNGMDVVLNSSSITYKVIGGIVELYIFAGPTPEEVIRQYHDVIGHPAMVPYWSLGFHQCRWGYRNLTQVEAVVANYSAVGLPLEVMWSDIDYMKRRFRNFEFDENRFPVDRMRAFVDRLHAAGQHWVPIVDAGTAAQAGSPAFEEGNSLEVWVRDYQGGYYLSQVWPGMVYYPDWFNPATQPWWTRAVQRMYSQVPLDGLWVDMNEAASFCTGTICRAPDPKVNNESYYWLTVLPPADNNLTGFIQPMTTCQMDCEEAGPDSKLAYPPYMIHNWMGEGQPRNASLDRKGIATNARHYNGVQDYDVHNLYGSGMSQASAHALANVTGKRPFVVTRSSSPGAGTYAFHWTGDNGANWANLFWSIQGIIYSNFWWLNMVGADICGFNDETTTVNGTEQYKLSDDEYHRLCLRWASAGAFYPFSRNHMNYGSRDHEFYRWPDVTAAAARAYGLRYRLLTYLYSAFHIAHVHGGTVARPLFFADPSDPGARNASMQWMLGEAVLVSPVITPNTSTITPYFTKGAWYSLWDYSRLDSNGANHTLTVPQGDIAVHLRGGSIIPLQEYANTTRAVQHSPLTLVVALPADVVTDASINATATQPLPPYYLEAFCRNALRNNTGKKVACGRLYLDGGDELTVGGTNTTEAYSYALADASGRTGSLLTRLITAGGPGASTPIQAIHVLGLPKGLVLAAGGSGGNGTSSGNATSAVGQGLVMTINGAAPGNVTYDGDSGVVRAEGLENLTLNTPLAVSWRL